MQPESPPLPRPQVQAPENRYHATLNSPNFPKLGQELDRLHRFIGRLGAWECLACQEIHPTPSAQDKPYAQIFGFCGECWLEHESLDRLVDFDLVPAQDIAAVVPHYYRDADFFDCWAGQRAPERLPQHCPRASTYLSVAYTWFGEEKVNKALSLTLLSIIPEHAVRWHPGLGWVPVSLSREAFPDPTNRKAWQRIYDETLVPVRHPATA